MRMRRCFVASLAALLVASSCLLTACSGGGQTSGLASGDSSQPATSSSSSGSASQQESSSAADEQRKAEEEELKRQEELFQQTVEQKDTWADGVVVDSLNALAGQGAIAPLPEDFLLFEHVFQFEPVEGGYDIVFLDEGLKSQLTGDFSLDLTDGSKVALCREYHMLNDDGTRARDVMVPYTDKDGEFTVSASKTESGRELLATPTLAPDGWGGDFNDLRLSVSDEAFANSIDECRYLIALGSCYANVKEDYYAITPTAEGTIDRVDVTTIVLVIDAKERQVLHIENIGTDVPEGSGDAAKLDNYGDRLTKEALAYVAGLLPKKE